MFRPLKMRIWSVLFVIPVGLSGFLIGCESKFQEKSPEVVQGVGISIEQRRVQKSEIENRIQKVASATGEIRRLFGLLRRVRFPEANSVHYTPLDFINDINSDFLARLSISDTNLRSGPNSESLNEVTVDLPSTDLSQDCQSIQGRLERQTFSTPDGTSSGDLFIYQVRSCKTEGHFKDFAEIEVTAQSFRLKMAENLSEIFPSQIIVDEIESHGECESEFETGGRLRALECVNLIFELTKTDAVHFEKLDYNRHTPNVFFARLNFIPKDQAAQSSGDHRNYELNVNQEGHLTLEQRIQDPE